MCAGCFSHLLADARLKDESATCPNCRCELNKNVCSRNLAVEKAISELPSECQYCSEQLPRCGLEYHERELCQERCVPCAYSGTPFAQSPFVLQLCTFSLPGNDRRVHTQWLPGTTSLIIINIKNNKIVYDIFFVYSHYIFSEVRLNIVCEQNRFRNRNVAPKSQDTLPSIGAVISQLWLYKMMLWVVTYLFVCIQNTLV